MTARSRDADIIVVGGGPAGSVVAWDLARQGVDVLLLERTQFPRDKVCGDYVEPRGLRILELVGCLERLEQSGLLAITDSATFVDGECRYRGPIPFYGRSAELSPHGYIIPRVELDDALLGAAARAGARVHQKAAVIGVHSGPDGVEVTARRAGTDVRYRAPLIVGADGANSVVGTTMGMLADDERHIAVAQRAYMRGAEGNIGEAVFWFDEQLFPGYGWMFPMADGRVNVGVGILSETRRRLGVHIPSLFRMFIERVRKFHPRSACLELCAPAIGGIVKTYGGARRNYFPGGVLIGDAGSFVDPMTGEGITPAFESALLAAPVLMRALEVGHFHGQQLSEFEASFRRYFDPAMDFLDLCAATLRNNYLARPWLRALARGCELAQKDPEFALVGGSYFGGLDIWPRGILGQIWVRIAQDLVLMWPRSAAQLLGPKTQATGATIVDLVEWQGAWSRSALRDPLWHARWSMDLQRKWVRVLASMARATIDPRAAGLTDT
jgi:geranylgeranyl reductase family protein